MGRASWEPQQPPRQTYGRRGLPKGRAPCPVDLLVPAGVKVVAVTGPNTGHSLSSLHVLPPKIVNHLPQTGFQCVFCTHLCLPVVVAGMCLSAPDCCRVCLCVQLCSVVFSTSEPQTKMLPEEGKDQLHQKQRLGIARG